MIELDIPGRAPLRLEHLAMDVNGAIAKDGRLPEFPTRLVAALRK